MPRQDPRLKTIPDNFNERIQDRTIRHMLFLEGLKTRQAREVDNFIVNEVIPDLQDQLAIRLARIENMGYDQGIVTTQRIETQIAALQNISGRFNGDIKQMVQGELFELAKDEVEWQTGVIRSESGGAIDMALPDPQQLRATIMTQPFDGRNFEQWFSSLEAATKQRIGSEIRRGVVQGRTIQQHTRAIIGTRSAGYTDGIIQASRREAEAIVRTSVAHVQNTAHNLAYEANSDIIKGVVWNSTLDTSTCIRCQSLDGTFYALGKPRPPLPRHVNCLHPDSVISSGFKATAVSKRFFEGDMVFIRTASGNNITCTPNHPILRDGEFVSADSLVIGDNLISDGRVQGVRAGDGDDNDAPPTVEQVFNAFTLKPDSVVSPVPTSTPDFHGDGVNGEVAVIFSDGKLLSGFKAPILKKFFKLNLIMRNRRASSILCHLFSGFCSFNFFFKRSFSAFNRFMSVFYLRFALFFSHLIPFKFFGLRLCSSCNAISFKNSSNNASRYSKMFSDSIFTHGFVHSDNIAFREEDFSFSHDGSLDVLNEDVFEDKIVSIKNQPYSGFVYNLETEKHYYFAGGIATHNCRCAYSPVLKGADATGLNLPQEMRSSMNGQVPRDLSYNDWLKKQSAEIQEEALGAKRAALFRKGDLSVNNFVSRSGNVKTLADIRRLEADAFEKAGLQS